MALDGSWNLPMLCRRCLKPEETTVIFWVANHHQSVGGASISNSEHRLHQPSANAASLTIGRNGDRSDENQWMSLAFWTCQQDWPTL